MGYMNNHWTGSKVIYLIELNMYNIKVYLIIINVSHARYHRGSFWDPLLFIIYTNDLPLSLTDTKATLFADDTTLYTSSKQLDEPFHKINHDLDCLCDWFKANKLSLNIAQTNLIHVSPYGMLLKRSFGEFILTTN